MKATIKLGGKITLEIDERDEMETLHKAIILSSPKTHCDVCGKTIEPYFSSNKDKEGNVYVNAKCPQCGARSKLGRYKVGGYFWHDYEKYVSGTATKPSQQEEPPIEAYDDYENK